MATVAELLVRIGADGSGLRKELAASQRQLKRAFGPDAIGFSKNLAIGMGAITAALGGVGIAAVKMAADFEQSKIAFTTMLGSAAAAESMLSQLATFAEKTPFEFEGLVQSSKKLLAYGYAAQEIIPMLNSIGDAVAAVGGSADVLDRVTLAFGQMRAKGFVSGEEMRQLAEAGIPAWQMLSNVIGKTIPETMKLAENKALDANAAIAGMLSQMSTKYGGMMEKQSNTITGILSNIKDKGGSLMRALGDEIVVALDLKTKLKGSLEFLDQFAGHVKNSGIKQALAETIPPEVQTAMVAIAGAITAILLPALFMLGTTTVIVGVALWKLVAIGAGLALLGKTAWDLADASSDASMRLKGMSGYMSDIQFSADNAAVSVDRLARATANLGAGVGSPEEYFAGSGTRSMYQQQSAPPVLSSDGGGGGADKLIAEAKRVSEAIEREWAQTTKTQLEQLDRWQSEHLADLDKTRSANENYERDKERVAATYSVRRLKILQEEAISSLNTFKSIRDGYQDIMSGMAGLKGSAKDVSDINKTYDDKAKAASDYFEKISQDYLTGTEVQKQAIVSALTAQNIAYQVSADGKLNLDKAAADASAAYQKQKLDEMNTYYATAKDVQSQIDEAYRQNSMAKLQEALTAENAIRMNDYTAQQSMMTTFQQAFLQAHQTTAMLMASVYSSALSGLETAFTGLFSLQKTLGETILSLGQALLNTIAQFYAKQLSGQIMVALFGKQDDAATMARYAAKTAAATASTAAITAASTASIAAITAATTAATAATTAASVASGAAIAAAWAPAAAMVSLATLGANSIPAMAGITATTAMATMMSLPKLANGGITTGPSLAVIGEGRHSEAVLPLSDRVFSKLADGITSKGGGGQTVLAPTFQIQAIDGKSVEKWLNNGGGKKIAKYFGNAAANFEAVTI